MNRFITAIKDLDVEAVKRLLEDPKWRLWSEPSGKNALHYLCGLGDAGTSPKSDASLSILKLLLNSSLSIDSVHRIEDKNCAIFPATPLWYAYTRGRNEKLYKYLLENGADSRHCWWAIAWYDDVQAANLWLEHGATLGEKPSLNELFLTSFYGRKINFAKWALERGGDVNARGPGGITALMVAVRRKDEENIKWLFVNGADPDLEDEKGMTARKIAETKGPKRLLQLMSAS